MDLNAFEDELHIVDGLPIPVCKFARAHFSKIFKGEVAYGYCATKKERYDDRPKSFLKWLVGTRRLIETVIGQLTERFQIEKVWARDLWHQYSRFWRKLLAHTTSIRLNLNAHNEPLQFERLVCS